jgi:hypothetical protein
LAHTRERFAGYWREIWAAPGLQFAEAAYRGELSCARMRIVIILLVIWIPLLAYIRQPVLQHRLGLAACILALLETVFVLLVVKRRLFVQGMGFVSTLLDVSLISGVLVFFILLGMPAIAANSRIVYPLYFFAIMASSLPKMPSPPPTAASTRPRRKGVIASQAPGPELPRRNQEPQLMPSLSG